MPLTLAREGEGSTHLARAASALLLILLAACQPRAGVEREAAVRSPATGATNALPRSPGTDFRVLSWNVSGRSFLKQSTGFRAVCRLIDPDVLLLDEVPGAATVTDVELALRGLRGPAASAPDLRPG